jgi:iron complex transport system ATP-binding protein
MRNCIQLDHVTFAYRRERPVLMDVSLTVEAGTFLSVVGPNGAGKSTLISLLAGLIRPQAGTIAIDGCDIDSYARRELACKVAMVRQEHVPTFGFSVTETVLMARIPHFSPWGFERQVDRRIVADALEMTDTARFASRPLAGLSGGERQRVFIARALAQDTPILLLDEPTSFLDLHHQVGIYDLLRSVQRNKHRTVVAITHDINLAAQYCDQALLLQPAREPPATGQRSRPAEAQERYTVGSTQQVFRRDEIERVFAIQVFSARVGTENVFLPLGKMAKDAGLGGSRPDHRDRSKPIENT